MINLNQELEIIELEEKLAHCEQVIQAKNAEIKECKRVILDLSLELEDAKKWNRLFKKIIRKDTL